MELAREGKSQGVTLGFQVVVSPAGDVRLLFSQPVSFFDLPPVEARHLARALKVGANTATTVRDKIAAKKLAANKEPK